MLKADPQLHKLMNDVEPNFFFFESKLACINWHLPTETSRVDKKIVHNLIRFFMNSVKVILS